MASCLAAAPVAFILLDILVSPGACSSSAAYAADHAATKAKQTMRPCRFKSFNPFSTLRLGRHCPPPRGGRSGDYPIPGHIARLPIYRAHPRPGIAHTDAEPFRTQCPQRPIEEAPAVTEPITAAIKSH